MKHIKSWQDRVNHGDSIYAKATALECEVAELRAYIKELEKPERFRIPTNWVDYQKILVAYIRHVGEMEGIDFLTHTKAEDLGLTQPEFDALLAAAGR